MKKTGAVPEELLNTLRGFQESRVLLSAIELDLFTALGDGADAAGTAARLGTEARATEILMNALTAMGFLVKKDGNFFNSVLACRFLTSESTEGARAGLLHYVNLWKSWSTLTECLRAGTSVLRAEPEERGEDWTNAFIAAMEMFAIDRAPALVKAIGTEGVRKLLDVGGGSAAYSIAFARASESLRAEVLDLEPVCAIARQHIESAGLSGRVSTRAGDLYKDDLGQGYDLILVSSICHMLSPEENLDLLGRCLKALCPGGRTVVQDFLLDPDKTSPRMAALFAVNMLVGTRGGNSYSAKEYEAWMREAGYAEIRRVDLAAPTGLMIGTRP